MAQLRVWDLPTRLFHWLFAFSFAAAWTLGESESLLGWHTYFGYLLAGLVLFRLVWGFVGEEYSRFRSFPLEPAAAWRYLKEGGRRHLGHNPAGAVAVYALLALGLATALTGIALLGADKGIGPLADLFPHTSEHLVKEVHEFLANTMLLLVFSHLAGVVLSSLRHRENLPRAMVTGYKNADSAAPNVRLRYWGAIALLIGIGLFSASHDFSAGCDANPLACEQGEEDED